MVPNRTPSEHPDELKAAALRTGSDGDRSTFGDPLSMILGVIRRVSRLAPEDVELYMKDESNDVFRSDVSLRATKKLQVALRADFDQRCEEMRAKGVPYLPPTPRWSVEEVPLPGGVAIVIQTLDDASRSPGVLVWSPLDERSLTERLTVARSTARRWVRGLGRSSRTFAAAIRARVLRATPVRFL